MSKFGALAGLSLSLLSGCQGCQEAPPFNQFVDPTETPSSLTPDPTSSPSEDTPTPLDVTETPDLSPTPLPPTETPTIVPDNTPTPIEPTETPSPTPSDTRCAIYDLLMDPEATIKGLTLVSMTEGHDNYVDGSEIIEQICQSVSDIVKSMETQSIIESSEVESTENSYEEEAAKSLEVIGNYGKGELSFTDCDPNIQQCIIKDDNGTILRVDCSKYYDTKFYPDLAQCHFEGEFKASSNTSSYYIIENNMICANEYAIQVGSYLTYIGEDLASQMPQTVKLGEACGQDLKKS